MSYPGRRTPALLGETFPLPVDRPFTTTEAAEAGLGEKVMRRLVDQGLLRRVLKGVYVVAQLPDSLPLRARALRLLVPEHAVIVDWTAVWLHTGLLPPWDRRGVPPVQLFRHAGHTRLRNRICRSGERTFDPGDTTVRGELEVTTPLRTALDVGRLAHRDVAIGALDGLLRHGGFTRDELVASVGRFRGQRGVVQLRALAPLADGRAESPGESLLRLRWLDVTTVPAPTPQVGVPARNPRFWLDLGVPELAFAMEYDGVEFHSSEADRLHDHERRRWITEREGWIVIAVRKENVSGPSRDVEGLLLDGVRRARMRLGTPSR